LTPEGKLVDPTYCRGINESYFIPYTDKLIVNGKITESICDLCYPKSAKDLDMLMCHVASQHGARFEDVKNQGYYQGIGINHDRYLNKIVYYDALPHDLVVQLMEGMDPLRQKKFNVMFSPCVKSIEEGAPRKLIHDPTLTFGVMSKRFNTEQKPICSLYAGYDVTAQSMGKDMVWDRGDFKKPPLVNKSLKTGKFIQDIPPLKEIIDKHSLPTQKKRLQKVVATSEKYNLSPQEVVMLSNPFLFPHPHLMTKAGWESIPRIKTADLIAN
jgi:hypothetical protein